MKKLPLVSVCIPTYNREKIIGNTIESVLNQTYQNIEIIISDNASTDNTYKIIQNYANQDLRVKVYQMKINMGPVENWINCHKNSNGKFIKFLWSDDYIDDKFIENAIQVFNEKIGFVYFPVKWYDVKTMKVDNYNIGFKLKNTGSYTIDFYIQSLILKGNVPVSASCALFKKDIIDDLFASKIVTCLELDYKINGAGFDALMFLFAYNKYKEFHYIGNKYSYFGMDPESITIKCGEKLIPYYYSIFFDFMQGISTDKILLSKFKAKVFFVKNFHVKDIETKNLLNRLLDLINLKIHFIYFIKIIIFELVIKKITNILKRIFNKVFLCH